MKELKSWTVVYTKAANKQLRKMPDRIQEQVHLLAREMELTGPMRANWSHFGSLKKGPRIPEKSYHCHVKSGKPTYVVCWVVEDKQVKIIEIYYVGTHENAPY